jgi:hypothetical protein
MKSLFFIGIVFFFLTGNSCRKDRSFITSVTGTISEKGTGNKISGAIILLGRKNKNSFSATSIQTVKSVTSNSLGEYKIEYEEDEEYTYFIVVKKVPYYESAYQYPSKGRSNLLNIALSAPSYLKLKVKNLSGADRLAIGYPCFSECDFYGTSVDTTTAAIPVNASENLKFYWLIYKYSIDTVKDSALITPSAFDTMIFNLNY